jgi:hypothetical protein
VYLGAAAKEAKTALIAHHNGINFKAVMVVATELLIVQQLALQYLIQAQVVAEADLAQTVLVAQVAVD